MPQPLGTDRRNFAWLWLLLGWWFTPVAAQTGIFDIPQLMQILGTIEARESTFTEQKILTLLSEPVVSAGTLRYRRPGYIERVTVTPRQERFIYENGKVTIESAGRQHQVQIKEHPTLGALIESIRATLAGDADSLQQYYQLRLLGTRGGWSLEMSPFTSALLSRIRLIRISGVQDQLRRVEILETSDDLTIMMIDASKR